MKKSLAHEEALSSDIVGQAHVESVGLKIFEFADQQDREAKFHKYVYISAKTINKQQPLLLQEHDQGFFHI